MNFLFRLVFPFGFSTSIHRLDGKPEIQSSQPPLPLPLPKSQFLYQFPCFRSGFNHHFPWTSLSAFKTCQSPIFAGNSLGCGILFRTKRNLCRTLSICVGTKVLSGSLPPCLPQILATRPPKVRTIYSNKSERHPRRARPPMEVCLDSSLHSDIQITRRELEDLERLPSANIYSCIFDSEKILQQEPSILMGHGTFFCMSQPDSP